MYASIVRMMTNRLDINPSFGNPDEYCSIIIAIKGIKY